jgi:periplasmic copper chaperone A
MSKSLLGACALLVLSSGAAMAHATLEQGEGAVGASYKAVFRVPHGCDGKPTNTVRVQIPEGVITAKPMPKAGWTLEKVTGAYAGSYEYYGRTLTEGVKEIVWSGGNLGDDEYDEFVVRVFLTKDLPVGQMLYFPIVQECPEGAAERWIEIPKEGQDPHDLEGPAPGIKLIEKPHAH